MESLKSIPDFRVDIGKIEYPLHEVLFMTLFALLKGNTSFKDIFAWMIFNTDNTMLKTIFEKDEIKVPSKSTFHTLLINTDTNALESVFREYFWDYIAQKSIAIDGKWLRGSDVNGQYTQEGHKAILNILDKDIKIVFAHKFLDKNKRSEIKALQEVLEDKLFSSEGQIFSFDALLTQSEILNTIDAQGNKYIAKLKDNQLKLKEKAIKTIEIFESANDTYEEEAEYLNENKKRVSRKVELFESKSSNQIMHHNKFNNIQSLIKVTKTLVNPTTGEITTSHQYLMANFWVPLEGVKLQLKISMIRF